MSHRDPALAEIRYTGHTLASPLTPANRLTAGLIAVPVLVDAAHGVLNAIFRPFSGLFDDALHTLHALGGPAVLAGMLLAGWRLVDAASARPACLHPAWLPGLSGIVNPVALALLHASDPLMGAYGIELDRWPPGRVAWFAGYGLVLAACCLSVPLRHWARGAGVWVAGMLLFARAVEWSGFTAD